MADYTYYVDRLRPTGNLTEVPMQGVTFGFARNEPAAWAGQIVLDPDDDGTTAAAVGAVNPGDTVLYIERDGALVYAGVYWPDAYGSDSTYLSPSGEDLLSYYAHRLVDFTERFGPGMDQFEIIRQTLIRANASVGGAGDIGLIPTPDNSGILRQDTYESASGRTLLDHWQALARMHNGFEFAPAVEWGPGDVPVRRLRMQFPAFDDSNAALPLTFVASDSTGVYSETASNVASYTWARDGGSKVIRALAIAPQPDGTQRQSWQVDMAPINAGHALLDASTTLDDVSVQQTIVDRARGLLAVRGEKPEPTFTVNIDEDDDNTALCAPGQWRIGTKVEVLIVDPQRFPNSETDPVAFRGRIVAATVRASPEQVTFTVNPLAGQGVLW